MNEYPITTMARGDIPAMELIRQLELIKQLDIYHSLIADKTAPDWSLFYVTSPPVLSCDTSVSNKSSGQIEMFGIS